MSVAKYNPTIIFSRQQKESWGQQCINEVFDIDIIKIRIKIKWRENQQNNQRQWYELFDSRRNIPRYYPLFFPNIWKQNTQEKAIQMRMRSKPNHRAGSKRAKHKKCQYHNKKADFDSVRIFAEQYKQYRKQQMKMYLNKEGPILAKHPTNRLHGQPIIVIQQYGRK